MIPTHPVHIDTSNKSFFSKLLSILFITISIFSYNDKIIIL